MKYLSVSHTKFVLISVIIYTLLLNSLKIQQVYPSPIRLKTLLPQDLTEFCAHDQCKVIFPNNTISILPLEQFYAFIVANSSQNGYLNNEQSNKIEEIRDNDIAPSISSIHEHENEKIDTPAFEDIATTTTFKYETSTEENQSETTLPDSTHFLYSQPDIPANVNNLKDTLEKSYNAEDCNSTTTLPIPDDNGIGMVTMFENHDIARNSPENKSTLQHLTDLHNDRCHLNIVSIERSFSKDLPVPTLENFTPAIMADQYTNKCKMLYPNGTIIEQCPLEVLLHDDKSSNDSITDMAGNPLYTNKHGHPVTDSEGYAVSTDTNGHPIYTDSWACNPITDRHGDPAFTDKCQNPITDRFGYAVYTDKDGNPITDSHGKAVPTDHNQRAIFTDKCGNMITDKNRNAIYTDEAGNMITDKKGNAIYTDEYGKWMTDANGMATEETPVYTYSDGKPITDEKGHYVYTDSDGNPILKGTIPMKSDMVTDQNGNVIYTDKDGKWMTDSNGMAITPIAYTYSDGKPITDEKGHYVYTDSDGNPILKGTTPMESNDDYVYEDTSTEFYDYDNHVEKIPDVKMEEAKKMTKCISKKINQTNIVCVCNFTYCDKFLPISTLPKGKYLWVTSTKSGLRFEKQNGELSENKGSQDAFFVNSERKFQNIFGFGGTFTDSASASIQHLKANMRNKLLESYFGFFGIHYTIGRVPVGGTTSLPRPYTYLDHTNGTIEGFMLTEYDYKYKIPAIQQANSFIHETPLKLIASAWLAPKWMNEKCNYSYADALKRDYWSLWAQYHIRFFDQYANQNITFWALTTGSEPMFMYHNTTMPSTASVSWSPYDQQQWVAHHLAPQLHNSTYKHLLILAYDGNRENLPFYMKWFFENFEGKKYKKLQYFKVNEAYEEISGIALHWYTDTKENLKYLNWINELYPNKSLIYTEACCVGVTELGSWDCAERYAINIITNLNHWISGWIDWNLALELEDEPNLKPDTSSPIIINADKNEFYKQPNYYVLGHFSKFILPNSIRIQVTPSTINGVSAVAVQRPDAGYVIIFYNQNEHDREVVFVINKTKKLSFVVAAKSINSVIFW